MSDRIVIANTPTEDLLAYRAAWVEMLGFGLSKQARKAVEIRIGAVDYVLRERGAPVVDAPLDR